MTDHAALSARGLVYEFLPPPLLAKGTLMNALRRFATAALGALILTSLAVPNAHAVTIDWVTVGDPGNTADTTTYGAVAAEFRIMEFEWTNSQYVEFLNAVDPNGTNPNAVYNTDMGNDARGGISFDSGGGTGAKYAARTNMGNKPVNYVSWFDAARVANWLHNGQGSSSTEPGTLALLTTGLFGLPCFAWRRRRSRITVNPFHPERLTMLNRSFSRPLLTTAALLAVSLSAAIPGAAHAEVSFTWATVGNAGNAADSTGYGAVGYEYRIATTEVTNAQYAEFLNAVAATDTYGLYNTNMSGNDGGITRSGASGSYTYAVNAGRANTPVGYVSWYDSVRFINWLHNGQGNGSTETGAYTLLGGTETPSNGLTVTRNEGALYSLASENEWYKAAYHDASAGTAGTYFTYATGSNSIPVSDQPGDNAAAVNYFNDDGIANGFNDGYVGTGSTTSPSNSGVNPFTDVGAYTDADSPYGTFDQNGNVWEWNEELIGSSRGLRGGSLINNESYLRSSGRFGVIPSTEGFGIGIRVASPVAVPEPSTWVTGLVGIACAGWGAWRRRRAR